MLIVIAPASTRTTTAAIQALLTRGVASVHIKAFYRDLSKVPADFQKHQNFEAVQGDVEKPETLDFSGADVVLAVTPPTVSGDNEKHATTISRNVADALENAKTVRKLVLLSSIGADLSSGVGELKTNHLAEKILSKVSVPEVTFVRCAYFMENWTRNLDTLKNPEPFIISTITPLDWKFPMVAERDIGYALSTEILKETPPPTKPHVYELHGPEMYSPNDVHRSFSEALGRPVGIKAIQPDELPDFYAKIFPPESVNDWIEMNKSFLPGGVLAPDKIDWDKTEIHRGESDVATAIKKALEGSNLDT